MSQQAEPGDAKHSSVERLCHDALATLEHHYGLAQHQQDVRDRWYRYYLVTTGTIVSLAGATFGSLSRTPEANPKTNLLDVFALIGWVFPLALSLIVVLGVIFLALYLTQIVNYQYHFASVSRVYEALEAAHSQTLNKLSLPNPFTFGYGKRPRHEGHGIPSVWHVITLLRRGVRDAQMWGADFWSNVVPIFINSFCIATAWLSYAAWNKARKPPLLSTLVNLHDFEIALALFTGVFVLQIAVRQWLLWWATLWAERDFQRRFPKYVQDLGQPSGS